MTQAAIFLVGFLLFFIVALFFPLLKKKKDFIAINRLVFFTTTVSYAVLITGVGVFASPSGDPIYPTRWLFYILSCGLLMYEIAKIFNKTKIETLEMIVLNSIVMLTGFLASIILAPYKWLFFIISGLAFIIILQIIHKKSAKENKFIKQIRWYVTITWSFFPIIWLLAPTGFEILTPAITALMYLLLDFITKIVFGYYTVTSQAK